jgi:hypothetical protein
MRWLAFLLISLVASGAAHAEFKKVARADSKLLLSMPYLDGGRQVFNDGGWSSTQKTNTAYAALVPQKGVYPRAQVYWDRAAPQHYWKVGSSLDTTWIKQRVPFFKDKSVQIDSAAPNSDALLRVTRFSVDTASCVAFEMRQTFTGVGDSLPNALDSFSGIYCPPVGTPLTDELVQQVTEGIFVRRDGRIERALPNVNKPLPFTN